MSDRDGYDEMRLPGTDGGATVFGLTRRRVHQLVEVARDGDHVSRALDVFIVTLILLNVAAFIAETVPWIAERHGDLLYRFEVVSVAIFTIEYIARVWACVEMPFLSRMGPFRARLRFATRPYLIIDLLAILPFFLSMLLAVDLRSLRIVRLFRILKLSRYSPAAHTLLRVIASQRRTLLGTLLMLMMVLLFVSTAAYYAERTAQPDKFGTIPDAAWWAIATLTTVGYGDVAPVTLVGKLVGSVAMVLGIVVLALPIAIIASGYANEVGNRDFVITWSQLARIPVLAGLDTKDLTEVLRFLRARRLDPFREVIAVEDRADTIFFIVSGEVRQRSEAGVALLRVGDCFGEVAMLEGLQHEHSYATTKQTRLLCLDRDDFEFLGESQPHIVAKIVTLAAMRREARANGMDDPTSAAVLAEGDGSRSL